MLTLHVKSPELDPQTQNKLCTGLILPGWENQSLRLYLANLVGLMPAWRG